MLSGLSMTDIEAYQDPTLVRWVAHMLVQGMTITEIKGKLRENAFIDTQLPSDGVERLIRLAQSDAKELRSLVIAQQEMGDTDWMRLESYARRKRSIERIEQTIVEANDLAESVGHLGQVVYMEGALHKAQDALDDFTGAKAAKPVVQVNLSYDPLDQMRTIIQEEVQKEMNTVDVIELPEVAEEE